MTAHTRQMFPEGTVTVRATCTCGHPARHHEAGTCWTDQGGAEVQDHPACQCPGLLPRSLLDAVEGAS